MTPGSWIRRRRCVLVGAAVVLGLLAAGFILRASVLPAVGWALVQSDPLAKVDALVILAGGTPERELEAADLYLAGWAPCVIVTKPPEREATGVLIQRGVRAELGLDQRLRFLRELGVPAPAIVLIPDLVESTMEEAGLLAIWAREHRAKGLIVITANLQTKRTGYIFRRALEGQDVQVLMRPVSGGQFDPDTWWQRRPTLRAGLEEWQNTLLYRLRHW